MTDEIHYCPTAIRSKAYPLIVEGFNELVQDGLNDGESFGPAPGDRTLHLTIEGEALAVATYRLNDLLCCYEVTLLYTEPSSRRLGYARRLWDKLRELAKTEGVGFVRVLVHPANEEAKIVAKALAGRLTGVRYDFPV